MAITVEIFSQGEEVVSGQTLDSNAAWLSRQLIQMGYCVTRHTTVGDRLDDLVTLLIEIADRSDCCICTGGLGPTIDDLTSEAVARAFQIKLEFDPVAYQQMEQFFLSRNRIMPEINRKQAYLPKGAIRLDNDWGTAPGFALQTQRCWFAFVPGVPYEMKQLFRQRITPLLKQKHSLQPRKLVTIKTIGIGESDIQQRIGEIALPEQVVLSFRAGPEEVQTKLLFNPGHEESEMERVIQNLTGQLGEHVYAIDWPQQKAQNLVSVIAATMQSKQLSLSVVESFSQGLIAAKCLDESWLLDAYYANSSNKICSQFGIEQEQDPLATAVKIAEAAKQKNATDYVLVQLCTADPSAIHDHRKPITLYNVLIGNKQTLTQSCKVTGNPKRKQNQAAIKALDFLRRYLQNSEILNN